MEKEKKQMYSARVAQANASELVVITYEIIEDCITEAADCMATAANSAEQEKNAAWMNAKQEIERARKLLNELMGSLDFRYGISGELLNLYRYVDGELCNALFHRKKESLSIALRVMTTLKKGFEGVAREDASAPVMANTQKVYAGLTYGKHSLNETFVNADENNRGFRA